MKPSDGVKTSNMGCVNSTHPILLFKLVSLKVDLLLTGQLTQL